MKQNKTGERHFVERRKYKRFYFKEQAYAFNSADFGQIIDISMGGLALVTGDKRMWGNRRQDLHIIFDEKEFSVTGFLIRKNANKIPLGENPRNGTTLYRCSLQFETLQENERAQLQHIITHHTVCKENIEN